MLLGKIIPVSLKIFSFVIGKNPVLARRKHSKKYVTPSVPATE